MFMEDLFIVAKNTAKTVKYLKLKSMPIFFSPLSLPSSPNFMCHQSNLQYNDVEGTWLRDVEYVREPPS